MYLERENHATKQVTTHHRSNRKKYSVKRWVIERTNSWHNRFRKLFTRYEKKVGNYLGLVQFSCCMIIYRKIILGRLLNYTGLAFTKITYMYLKHRSRNPSCN
ncbi:MAG TPA: hypothetical protein VIY08_07260 [Candidatus Nitrosocosmicus sp.]